MNANEQFWRRRQELLYFHGKISWTEPSIDVESASQLRLGSNARGLTRYMQQIGWCPYVCPFTFLPVKLS
jgi:hypothetical protein